MQGKKILIMAIIAIIVVGAGAFYGGMQYEKKKLSSMGLLRSSAAQGQGGNRQNGTPGQGRQGRGPNGGNFTSGQIISKDDKSITVKMQDGSSKIVYFSDSTTVGKSTQGSVSDLNTGEQVMANGTSNPDGSLSAQNIQIRPAQQN